MSDNGAVEVKEFRSKLGITQREAGPILGCSTATISHLELGYIQLGWQRRSRLREALAAFEAGGIEAVKALPPFRNLRVLRTVPSEDGPEMARWRKEMGLSRQGAARRLGFMSPRTIDAIERGKRRITDRVRAYMRKDEKSRIVQEDR